jgi:cytidylate kinase
MTNRELFDIQSEIIEDLAKKGKGVFVGRCADYVLREEENLVKIFIRADMDYRVDLYEKHHRKPENRSVEYVLEGMDRKKNTYYQFYTAMDWMDIKNYDLVINTAKVGIDAAVDMIVEYIKNMR